MSSDTCSNILLFKFSSTWIEYSWDNYEFNLRSRYPAFIFIFMCWCIFAILCSFAEYLKRFQDVFIFFQNNSYGNHADTHVTLRPTLATPEERTRAVADVVKCLGEELIPGIRNEVHLLFSKGHVDPSSFVCLFFVWVILHLSEVSICVPSFMTYL